MIKFQRTNEENLIKENPPARRTKMADPPKGIPSPGTKY
jgi:hypothetical protein